MIPTEFRIFKRGMNDGSKGKFIFDEQAARDVMADYTRHAADIMIDLEHLSLDEESKAYDPDARGWCKLAVRNGELWAIDVTWTPDGEARLNARKQRYVSPTFLFDKATRRVFAIHNIAMCGAPALDDIPALVAASKLSARGKLLGSVSLSLQKGDPMDLSEVLAKLGLPEDATLEDILAAIDALQVAAAPDDTDKEAASDDADPPPAEDDKDKANMKARRQARAAQSNQDSLVMSFMKKLDKKVDALGARFEGNEVMSLIRANARKFTPALEKEAATWPLAAIKGFIKHAPDVAESDEEPTEAGSRGAARVAAKAKTYVATDADRAVCKATGRKLVDLVAFKQKKLDEQNAEAV